MEHFIAMTLLHRLQAGSDADRQLAVNYTAFIGDQLAQLWVNHFATHKPIFDSFWNEAYSSIVLTDVLTVFSRPTADMLERAALIWDEWGTQLKKRLFVAGLASADQAIKEVDELIRTLAGARNKISTLSNDNEKRQYAVMLMPLYIKPL